MEWNAATQSTELKAVPKEDCLRADDGHKTNCAEHSHWNCVLTVVIPAAEPHRSPQFLRLFLKAAVSRRWAWWA